MTRARLLPALALAAGLALSVTTVAQPPGGGPPGVPGKPIPGGRAGPGPDRALPVVPKSAGAFVTLKLSALAEHADMKPVLADLAKNPEALAGVSEAIGVSPAEIDRVTLFWPRLSPRGGTDPVLVVTTRAPFNEARVLKALKADPVFDGDFRHGGGARWKAGAKRTMEVAPENAKPAAAPDRGKDGAGSVPPPPPSPQEDDPCAPAADAGPSDPLFYALDRGPFEMLFLIDDRTLVFLPGGGEFATMALLAATLKKNATGPLADAIAAAGKHTFAAGVHLTPIVREFDRKTPPELVPYTALLAARTAVLTGTLDKPARLGLTLTFDDAAAARRAAPVLEEGVATVAEKLSALANELKDSRRPFEKGAAPLVATFAAGVKKAAVKADGAAVTATTEIDVGPVAAKALGDLLQAVQSRKRAELRMNNLKQIGLALHSYHDVTGKFPANVYGPKGEPLLSWRVLILPYIEEDNLFRQFKLDEPWDSDHNKKLIEKMPKVYMAPEREHEKGRTFYQGFVGPDPRKAPPLKGIFGRPWLQEGIKDGIRITDIVDGTSNTLAVIEAGQGVIWSKPDDLPFGGAVPPLGEKGWDRTPALRFDGSTFLFPTNLKPEEFWPHVTINGGEVTPDLEERRGLGGRPRAGGAAPPVEGVPPPAANPPKRPEDGVVQLLTLIDLEQQVRDLEFVVAADVARAKEQQEKATEVRRAFQLGKVTRRDLELADDCAEALTKIATARAAQLTQTRERRDAAKAALEKDAKAIREK